MMKVLLLTMVIVLAAVTTFALTTGINADDDDENRKGDRGGLKFGAELSREQEVPAATAGQITRSTVRVTFDKAFTQVDVDWKIRGGENVVKANFYCKFPGANGDIALMLFEKDNEDSPLDFDGKEIKGTLTNADFKTNECHLPGPGIGRPVNNIVSLAFAMREGLIYANVHTTDVLGGEVRGQLLED